MRRRLAAALAVTTLAVGSSLLAAPGASAGTSDTVLERTCEVLGGTVDPNVTEDATKVRCEFTRGQAGIDRWLKLANSTGWSATSTPGQCFLGGGLRFGVDCAEAVKLSAGPGTPLASIGNTCAALGGDFASSDGPGAQVGSCTFIGVDASALRTKYERIVLAIPGYELPIFGVGCVDLEPEGQECTTKILSEG